MRPAWVLVHQSMVAEQLGELPMMLDDRNPAKAREQFDAGYRHGGGWRPFQGHSLNLVNYHLSYPGDPPLPPLAMTRLRDETIILYPYDWVCIVQPDKTFEIARMD